MTPRNPLSIISPAPIGTPWNDAHPEPSSSRSNVDSLIQGSMIDLMRIPDWSIEVHRYDFATDTWKTIQDGNEELDWLDATFTFNAEDG
jgi:hypothetical protein